MSSSTAHFDAALSPWRDAVEERLRASVTARPDCPERLRDAMAYSLLAGGKRLRPLLVLMACDACGGDVDAAMPAAVAIEMVHTYSLIHDDLPAMDDDDLRRGRPTCHIQFDEATAILAGDGLLTLAFETLASQVQPPQAAAACCADLAGAAGWEGMVGGQMADLQADDGIRDAGDGIRDAGDGIRDAGDGIRDTGDGIRDAGDGVRDTGDGVRVEGGEDEVLSPRPASRVPHPASRIPHPASRVAQLESIHRRKTGRLLACAVTMGGRIAGANPQTLRSLRTYGELIGLAFQIADDLLDVGGNAATMGKQVRKDQQAGKLTYPVLLGEAESRRRAEQLIQHACEVIEPLGEDGRQLKAVAHYIIERDR